jgi:hypothetical protein
MFPSMLLGALLMVLIVFDTTTIVLALESFTTSGFSVIQLVLSFVMKNKEFAPGILWLTLLMFVLVWPLGHWHSAPDHRPPR